MSHLNANMVKNLLNTGKQKKLKLILQNYDIPDIAVVIDQLPDAKKIKLYLLLPTYKASDVLLEVSQHSRKFILKSMKDKYIISLVEEADSNDSADILSEIPDHKTETILKGLSEKKQQAISPLINYDDDTAGHLMQLELIELPHKLTVKEATKRVKKKLTQIDGANYVYVTDKKKTLKGVISITELFTSHQRKKLSQIMTKDVVKIAPTSNFEHVAAVFRKQNILALPVVDKDGKLLGRVTVDDVIDIMEEEATEDMFKIAGVHPDEHVFDPVRKSIKRRLPWLLLNLITLSLASMVIAYFEDTIKSFVILAAFMPIIAGIGGNSGTQTLTLIVRGLALNRIHFHSAKKIIFKEMTVGLINGLTVGVAMAFLSFLWLRNWALGVVIIVAMTISLIVAGMIGSSIPIVLKKVNIDPAVASSVFITTITDIVGFFTFLGAATLLLQHII